MIRLEEHLLIQTMVVGNPAPLGAEEAIRERVRMAVADAIVDHEITKVEHMDFTKHTLEVYVISPRDLWSIIQHEASAMARGKTP